LVGDDSNDEVVMVELSASGITFIDEEEADLVGYKTVDCC
jgi:hypothetical protein